MEPVEIDEHLLNKNLKQFVMFTGLDVANNMQHNAIYNEFLKDNRNSNFQFFYNLLTPDNMFFKQKNKLVSKSVNGILKKNWPLKYLKERPALIVCFVDVTWDDSIWLEKKTECESKINSLRESIDDRDISLALILVEKNLTINTLNLNEKKLELCMQCKLNSKNVFVLSFVQIRNLSENINQLEKFYYEIVQDAYFVFLKKIRARPVPNNELKLLIRQQYKLAFISELRQDTHSALKYYKTAYQNISELDTLDSDKFEILNVASLLTFKMYELCFVHNNAYDAITQFQRHQKNFFFNYNSYLSPELAQIEFTLWKSQQCRLFAELFDRAVNNGLAAYSYQNPGKFFEESANYYKLANFLIKELKKNLSKSNVIQEIDFNYNTIYYGQRPWRINKNYNLKENFNVNTAKFIENAAKLYLEQNVKENYHRSLHLWSLAITQFKRYNCEAMQHIALINMADDYVELHKLNTALQLLHRTALEFTSRNFNYLLFKTLIKCLNVAYCMVNLNEYIWALVQLLNSSNKKYLYIFENKNENFIENCCQDFIENRYSIPPTFIKSKITDNLISQSTVDLATTQWQQYYNHSAQVSFSVEMSRLKSFLECSAKFLCSSNVFYANNLLFIEVKIKNFLKFAFKIDKCVLTLDEITFNKNHAILLENFNNKNKSLILMGNKSITKFYFKFIPKVDGLNFKEKNFAIRKISLKLFSRENLKANGSFDFEIELMSQNHLSNRIFINSDTKSDFFNWHRQCQFIKVLPQKRKVFLDGPKKTILLTDEMVDVPFILTNFELFSIKNIKIVGNQIYKEDFLFNNNVFVPVYIQDFINPLFPNESINLNVKLSSKSKNCIGIQIQIQCQIDLKENGVEGIEITKFFEIECKEPFESTISLLNINNEKILSLTCGQILNLKANIKIKASVTIYAILWKLEGDLQQQLQIVEEKLNKTCEDGDIIERVIEVKVPCKNLNEISVGDFVLEWKGKNSYKIVRSIFNLGQFPLISVPLVIYSNVLQLYNNKNSYYEKELVQKIFDITVRKPFIFMFQLCSICDIVLPLKIEFERSDIFVFSGFKKFSLYLSPGEINQVQVTMLALSVGKHLLPKLIIQCLYEECNSLIHLHSHKSLVPIINVMP